MLGSIKLLAKRFSNYQIVIRPHPFESLNAYRELAKLENVDVRQEGTSIEWINHAKVLIHQNCLTSIEAVMMGCEPVSLEWFNSPAISEESSRKTSYQANSQVELETFVGELLVGRTPQLSSEQIEIREEIIKKRYLAHDGQSAKRVFEAVRKAMKGSVGSTKKNLAHILVEADVKCLARILLGYKGFHYVRRKIIRDKHDYRRKAKLFSLDQVQGILQKLSEVSEEDHAVSAVYVGDEDMLRPRLGSGQTIKVEMV